jgi:hypothetical protein
VRAGLTTGTGGAADRGADFRSALATGAIVSARAGAMDRAGFIGTLTTVMDMDPGIAAVPRTTLHILSIPCRFTARTTTLFRSTEAGIHMAVVRGVTEFDL